MAGPDLIDRLAAIIERELDSVELVVAHPDTLRKIKALRIARAVAKTVATTANEILDQGFSESRAEELGFSGEE